MLLAIRIDSSEENRSKKSDFHSNQFRRVKGTSDRNGKWKSSFLVKSLTYSEGVEGTSDRKGKWSFRIEAIEAHRAGRGNELRLNFDCWHTLVFSFTFSFQILFPTYILGPGQWTWCRWSVDIYSHFFPQASEQSPTGHGFSLQELKFEEKHWLMLRLSKLDSSSMNEPLPNHILGNRSLSGY